VGMAGSFQVALRDMTFAEPGHTSASGGSVGPRTH
jgi:hypothetical protein